MIEHLAEMSLGPQRERKVDGGKGDQKQRDGDSEGVDGPQYRVLRTRHPAELPNQNYDEDGDAECESSSDCPLDKSVNGIR